MTDLLTETLTEVADHGDTRSAAQARTMLRFDRAVQTYGEQEAQAMEVCRHVSNVNRLRDRRTPRRSYLASHVQGSE